MRPIARILVAAGIIAAGIALACVFPTSREKVQTPPGPTYVVQHAPLTRKSPASPRRAPTLSTQAKRQTRKPSMGPKAETSPGLSPLAMSPDAARPEPPVMAKAFPSIAPFPDVTRRGSSPAGNTEPRGPRVHRVVDGDTLEGIAERYLGNAALADQIFRANRDLLEDPRLLPIDAKLTIPESAGDSP